MTTSTSTMPTQAQTQTLTQTTLLCGVGGQGTILAADLLAHAACDAGLDVKVSEIHGMAQRGGAVTTVVRFGEHVDSMVSDAGAADLIVSFETTEALRNIDQLKDGGSLVVNDESIEPLGVLTGKASMPQGAREELSDRGAILVPAGEIAQEAGNAKAANVVLLGALSAQLDFPLDVWEEAVRSHVPPKTVEVNLDAFHAGRQFAENGDDQG